MFQWNIRFIECILVIYKILTIFLFLSEYFLLRSWPLTSPFLDMLIGRFTQLTSHYQLVLIQVFLTLTNRPLLTLRFLFAVHLHFWGWAVWGGSSCKCDVFQWNIRFIECTLVRIWYSPPFFSLSDSFLFRSFPPSKTTSDGLLWQGQLSFFSMSRVFLFRHPRCWQYLITNQIQSI